MKKYYATPSAELLALQTGDIVTLSLTDGYAFDEIEREHLHDVSDWLN